MNRVQLQNYSPMSFHYLPTELSSSPPGPYHQEPYISKPEEKFKAPPILPPHLLQVILNKDTGISVSTPPSRAPSCLPLTRQWSVPVPPTVGTVVVLPCERLTSCHTPLCQLDLGIPLAAITFQSLVLVTKLLSETLALLGQNPSCLNTFPLYHIHRGRRQKG